MKAAQNHRTTAAAKTLAPNGKHTAGAGRKLHQEDRAGIEPQVPDTNKCGLAKPTTTYHQVHGCQPVRRTHAPGMHGDSNQPDTNVGGKKTNTDLEVPQT